MRCKCGHLKGAHDVNRCFGGERCGCRRFEPDGVNHPPHYTQGKVECIDAIESALTAEEFRGFLKGQVIKYIWRMNRKGDSDDAKKAQWYQERLVKLMEQK